MDNPRPGPGYFAAAIAALLGVALWIFISRSPHREPSPAIHVLAISPFGEWMASGTALGQVRLWKTSAPEIASVISETNGTLNDLQFSNQGGLLAIANKNITLIEVNDRHKARAIQSDQANYGTVRFSPDDKTLLTVNGRNEIVAIDLAANAARRIYCCTSIYGEVAFTPDGTHVVWAAHWPGMLDLRSGAVVGRFAKDRELMTLGPLVADPHGSLYMGSQDGSVYQWDMKTKARLAQSPPQTGYVRTIATIGDTGWIAYAPEDGPVTIWNPATNSSRIVVGARTTSNLIFDTAQNRMAFGTSTGEIQFWDLVENRLLTTLPRSR